MRLPRAASAAAVVAAGVLAAGCAPGPDAAPGAGTLTILGASSTRVLNEKFRELSDTDLSVINAGSSTLVQQLLDGSPGDVLITADRENMDRAVEQGLVEPPRRVARNSLVMVVPAGNPAGIGSPEDLAGTTFVLCDPQVPCGTAAEAIREETGVEAEPSSLEHQVADVLGKVVSGEADAGWVYRTDALSAAGSVEVLELPGGDAHPTEVMAAVTTSAVDRQAADRFVEELTSEEMEEVWAGFGWTPAGQS